MENPSVRFDDLSPGGSGSFGLVGRVDTLVARRVGDIVAVIDEAEAAAAAGSWVAGFVSYEAAPAFDSGLEVRPSGLHDPMRDLPLAEFQVYRTRVELDPIEGAQLPTGAYNVSGWRPDASRRDYRDSLAMTGRAIMAGEIIRGKHTFRLHAAFSGDVEVFYRDLVQSQRGPYGACIDVGRFRVVSASPERFFKRTGGTLTVSPVLASVRRGRWLEEDRQLAGLLLEAGDLSYSDRTVIKEVEAELAEIGELSSIPVEERLTTERLETLWHLTAKAGVNLAPDVALRDVFGALFPPVSVTGVPKRAAMELIALAEDTPRGVYCGAIGFLAPPGAGPPDASFSVAVRTVVIDQDEGVAEFGVGSPISSTSDVVSGYEEARLKAKVLVERRREFRVCERFRVESGVVRAIEAKTANLLASARYFGFDLEQPSAALRGLSGLPDPALVTLLVDRRGDLQIERSSAPAWAETPDEASIASAALVDSAVSTDNVFLFHHTTDTRIEDAASRQHPGADVYVIVNDHDEIAGALDSSVAVCIDGEWITPPRGCGNRFSAFRERLIETGIAREGVITKEMLSRAGRTATFDDVRGWRLIELP